MAESPETTPSPGSKLSKEQRSTIAKAAALRRWEKARKKKAETTQKRPAKAARPSRKSSAPREFSSALKTAEKRLAKAIQERAEAAAKYAVLSAEIPSLQQIIMALKNPMFVLPGQMPAMTTPTLEQIVGDMPLQYQNPPRRVAPPETPVIPVPQQLHPANNLGRAGGGAVGVDLAEGPEENEDQFLNDDSTVTGGPGWH